MDSLLLGKKVLVVTAHPDDESFIAAGTIYRNHQQGGSTHVLCATQGGNGRAYLERPHTEAELKQRRREELLEVTQVLGVSEYTVLDYPDGRVEEFVSNFSHDVAGVVETWHPEVLITFGPDGFTGHRDHSAVYAAAQRNAKHFSVPLITAAHPPGPMGTAFVLALHAKRKCDTYSDADSIASTITIDIKKEIKLRALQCYRSQWAGLNPYAIFTPDLAEHFLTHEYFHHTPTE